MTKKKYKSWITTIKTVVLRRFHKNVVNTDDARKLFKDVGYRGVNAADVQEPASEVAKAAYIKLLNKSKKPFAYLFAGGSGTGKTSAVKNLLLQL